MIPYRRLIVFFLLAAVAYVALSYLTFKVPATLAEAELCGFTEDDFNSAGEIVYPPVHAWWVSFVRQQEWWSTISIGLAFAFIGFALQATRKVGGVGAGAAVGGSVLAVSAICVSCLAPVLSVVGLGLAGSLLAGVPKWLIALNTFMLTGWGTLYLSRKLSSCELPRNAAAKPA